MLYNTVVVARRVEYGRLAQLVALPLDVREVRGSSPLASTKNKRHPIGCLLFLAIRDSNLSEAKAQSNKPLRHKGLCAKGLELRKGEFKICSLNLSKMCYYISS